MQQPYSERIEILETKVAILEMALTGVRQEYCNLGKRFEDYLAKSLPAATKEVRMSCHTYFDDLGDNVQVIGCVFDRAALIIKFQKDWYYMTLLGWARVPSESLTSIRWYKKI